MVNDVTDLDISSMTGRTHFKITFLIELFVATELIYSLAVTPKQNRAMFSTCIISLEHRGCHFFKLTSVPQKEGRTADLALESEEE